MLLTATVPWHLGDHCWDDVMDEAARRIYSAYARPLGIGRSPAVLAIDLYNLAFAGGDLAPEDLQSDHPSSCGRFAQRAIAPMQRVLGLARGLGLPVVHTRASRTRTPLSATKRSQPNQISASAGYEFHPSCAPTEHELVVEKERASAFYGTQLLSELVRQRIDTVVVIGETTSGCVRASVVDAYSHGFHVVVVEDAVFDRAWLPHCVNLFDMHHKYADVVHAHVLAGLLERADLDLPEPASVGQLGRRLTGTAHPPSGGTTRHRTT